MNEELRKKLPKVIRIKGVKGTLYKAGTYHEDGSFKTYIEYKFETSELNEKLKIGKKKRKPFAGLSCVNLGKHQKRIETSAFCTNSRRWLVFMDMFGNYPKTCPYEGDCDRCGYLEERKPTAHLLRKEKTLGSYFGEEKEG